MSELKEALINISEEVRTKIIPENIKAGVQIFDVGGEYTGLDTSDATATAEDIVIGKTAYVDGEKIEGVLTSSTENGNCNIETNIPTGFYEYDSSADVETWKSNIYQIITEINDTVKAPTGSTSALFAGCTELKYIKAVDLQDTTACSAMFCDCVSLVTPPTILNSQGIRSWGSCFKRCTNLTTPLIADAVGSNCYGFNSMYEGCSKIVTAPSYSAPNIEIMYKMFKDCTSLVNVPIYSTQKIGQNYRAWSGLTSFVENCPNLSDESLNNILQMCYASPITNAIYMTLANVGLSESQVERCKSLSNYDKLIAKGWTTGY